MKARLEYRCVSHLAGDGLSGEWDSGLSVDTKAQKQLKALIDAGQLVGRDLSKDSTDAALVDRSQVVDESVRRLHEAARTWRQGRIQSTIAGRPSNRDYCDERESLIGVHCRIAHGDARANATLFVTDCRVEFHEDHCSSIESHADSFVHPWPSIQRTGVPALASTSVSSVGRSEIQSLRPTSTRPVVSG